MPRIYPILLVTLIISVLTGCRSMLIPYPSQVQHPLDQLRSGTEVDVEELFGKRVNGADGVLYRMERGRIAQIQGKREASEKDFFAAMDDIRSIDESALVSVADTGAQAGAMLVNDNLIPYNPRGYERVMLHHYQALNFLLRGDLEGAMVEVRRGNFEQSKALERHQKRIDRAKQSGPDNQPDISGAMKEVDKVYAGIDEIAGRVKNSFQNAYTFFMSALVWESMGESNDAYIDYKKALEIAPANRYLQQAALRLAKALGMREQYRQLERRFPDIAANGRGWSMPETSGARLVVIVEEELIPAKRQIRLPIPLPGLDTFTAVSIPYYARGDFETPDPLRVTIDGVGTLETELVCEPQALAVAALKERMPAIVARQVVRAVAKAAATKAAYDEMGTGAAVAAGIVAYITESADRRSWLSLPANVQIAVTGLNPGLHSVSLSDGVATINRKVDLELREGRTTLLLVTLIGSAMYQAHVTF